jgi:hypothetical protein
MSWEAFKTGKIPVDTAQCENLVIWQLHPVLNMDPNVLPRPARRAKTSSQAKASSSAIQRAPKLCLVSQFLKSKQIKAITHVTDFSNLCSMQSITNIL